MDTLSKNLQQTLELIKLNPHVLEDKYIYSIKITVPVSPHNMHLLNSSHLNALVRTLVNSKMSIAGIDNRTWFNNNFTGGLYIVSTEQKEPDDAIFVHYNIWCISDKVNLDQIINTNLQVRIKKILPIAIVTIEPGIKVDSAETFVGKVGRLMNIPPPIHLNSPSFLFLTNSFKRVIISFLSADIRFIGTLYKVGNKSQ